MAEQQPSLPGFEQFALIGSGGFARVYRAYQPAFDRWVAIKVMSPTGLGEKAIKRFERECRAIGRVSDHPNIVSVYEAGVAGDGSPYIVMELCESGSLGDALARGDRLAVEQVVAAGAKVAGALQTAHEQGVLHLDVKPGNILLTRFGEAALADFGIASLVSGDTTTTASVSFSVVHAPPELLEGGSLSPESDLYSLGSTIYELLEGRPPYARGKDQSVAAYMFRKVRQRPEPMTAERTPPALAKLVQRTLARDPGERGTLSEFATALDRMAGHRRPSRHEQTRTWLVSETGVTLEDDRTVPLASREQPTVSVRRERSSSAAQGAAHSLMMRVVLAIVVLAMGAAAGILFSSELLPLELLVAAGAAMSGVCAAQCIKILPASDGSGAPVALYILGGAAAVTWTVAASTGGGIAFTMVIIGLVLSGTLTLLATVQTPRDRSFRGGLRRMRAATLVLGVVATACAAMTGVLAIASPWHMELAYDQHVGCSVLPNIPREGVCTLPLIGSMRSSSRPGWGDSRYSVAVESTAADGSVHTVLTTAYGSSGARDGAKQVLRPTISCASDARLTAVARSNGREVARTELGPCPSPARAQLDDLGSAGDPLCPDEYSCRLYELHIQSFTPDTLVCVLPNIRGFLPAHSGWLLGQKSLNQRALPVIGGVGGAPSTQCSKQTQFQGGPGNLTYGVVRTDHTGALDVGPFEFGTYAANVASTLRVELELVGSHDPRAIAEVAVRS